MIANATAGIEDLTLLVEQKIHVRASLEDTFAALLEQLGYERGVSETPDPIWGNLVYRHPAGRKAVFVGDLVDRGPRVVDCLRIVRNMVNAGTALTVLILASTGISRRSRSTAVRGGSG